ncbi:hypothetical protein ONZ45_g992 [Pleurotus djamor]|nr:hypothetical protein ONZ45_g992 [Pleurotus djamor]
MNFFPSCFILTALVLLGVRLHGGVSDVINPCVAPKYGVPRNTSSTVDKLCADIKAKQPFSRLRGVIESWTQTHTLDHILSFQQYRNQIDAHLSSISKATFVLSSAIPLGVSSHVEGIFDGIVRNAREWFSLGGDVLHNGTIAGNVFPMYTW